MDFTRTLISRFLDLFRRRKSDADLNEELRSHIEFAVTENMTLGMDAKQARTRICTYRDPYPGSWAGREHCHLLARECAHPSSADVRAARIEPMEALRSE
jgi:hypothetical protein